LGDAILVTFSAYKENETQQNIIKRAKACSLHILLRHGLVVFDLKSMNLGFTDLSRVSTVSSGSDTENRKLSSITETYELSLHVALTCGKITKSILGNFAERMDYCISGDCMSDLTLILESTKAGMWF
jgi:hypothetical protein